ncbi:hypothetical protein QBC47DRAFT_465178 [Echria macrotheca]|uniref:Uncharacterized protein n=1 Tax=Echria macrotheca TaxID=438768 RepID=A0AAJ0B2U2_9PEZI|nr:hypothetical protein QBC47DRAFT_465178 [Echria macrotheca]
MDLNCRPLLGHQLSIAATVGNTTRNAYITSFCNKKQHCLTSGTVRCNLPRLACLAAVEAPHILFPSPRIRRAPDLQTTSRVCQRVYLRRLSSSFYWGQNIRDADIQAAESRFQTRCILEEKDVAILPKRATRYHPGFLLGPSGTRPSANVDAGTYCARELAKRNARLPPARLAKRETGPVVLSSTPRAGRSVRLAGAVRPSSHGGRTHRRGDHDVTMAAVLADYGLANSKMQNRDSASQIQLCWTLAHVLDDHGHWVVEAVRIPRLGYTTAETVGSGGQRAQRGNLPVDSFQGWLAVQLTTTARRGELLGSRGDTISSCTWSGDRVQMAKDRAWCSSHRWRPTVAVIVQEAMTAESLSAHVSDRRTFSALQVWGSVDVKSVKTAGHRGTSGQSRDWARVLRRSRPAERRGGVERCGEVTGWAELCTPKTEPKPPPVASSKAGAGSITGANLAHNGRFSKKS